ncbi:MAG: phosphate-starvation-inducible PsiE family protein, partial [Sedimenticolaceae bacterium]
HNCATGDRPMMMGYLKKLERVLVGAMILMLVLVVLLSVVELGRMLIRDLATPPLFTLEIQQLLGIFGQFLLVLIGIELLESLKKYYRDGCVNVDVILSIALIALARKIITVDPKEFDPVTLIGIAAVILSLVAGYWVATKNKPSKATLDEQQDCKNE